MLTNWFTIKKCITNLQLLSQQENEILASQTKKEYLIIKKKKATEI
jgi:ribosomal protein S2